jgi:ABC-2 type transport system ATP-binding protein
MIQVENLYKNYGKIKAVQNLSLVIHPGEIYGFLGPNGAGKTTTIKILTGLLLPTSGKVKVGGFDIVHESKYAKQITSLIPDRPYVYEKLTPIEYLNFLSGIYQLNRHDSQNISLKYLDLFGLMRWKDELIEGFSHGMKQKVVMAGALLTQPKILIIDEPMVGLDPQSAKLVKEIFNQLAKQGLTILLSTHTLDIVEDLCARIGIIRSGELIAEGSLSELRTRAKNSNGNLEEIFLQFTGETDIQKKLEYLNNQTSNINV